MQAHAWGELRVGASGAQRTRAPSNGTTTLLPHLLATRFSQQKIFQDEFSIAGSKRRTANPARYFAVAVSGPASALTT
jgi:hypothetical protein